MGLFYNIKRAIVTWFSDIRVYKFGLILWGSSYYELKGWHVRKVLELIQPGDIFLRKYDHYLGSILIKGFWSHSAVYIGDNSVLHMLAGGITSEDILTFLRADHIMILRARDRVMATRICERAKKLAENYIEYDYDFNSKDTKKLYCTEFVDVCADNLISACTNRKILIPDDFLRCSALEKIWTDVG